MPKNKLPEKLGLWLLSLLRPTHDLRYQAFEALVECIGKQVAKLGMTVLEFGLRFSLFGISALILASGTHSHAMVTVVGASVVLGQSVLFVLAVRQGYQEVIHPALSRLA